jgi:hypothetical protein
MISLEKRVRILERLIFEDETTSRSKKPKANIFSKKIEEVKAAIEAGIDVNSVDRFGRTPLQIACSNHDSGIITLLLENGANPNVADKKGAPYLALFALEGNKELLNLLLEYGTSLKDSEYKNKPVLFYAIDGGIKDNLLLSLVDNDFVAGRSAKSNFTVIARIVHIYSWGKLDEKVYSALINKYISIMNNNGMLHNYFSRDSDYPIAEEIAIAKTSYLFDAIMKYKVWPFYECSEYAEGMKTQAVYTKIYSAAKEAHDCYIYNADCFMRDVINAANNLVLPIDFLADIITSEALSRVSTSSLYDMILSAFVMDSIDLAQSLINNGRDIIKKTNVNLGYDLKDVIHFAANVPDNSKITRLVCKILNIVQDSDKIIITKDSTICRDLLKTHNKKLLEWFIDNGYGKDISNCIQDDSKVSYELKELLKDDESSAKADKLLNDLNYDINRRLKDAENLLETDHYVSNIASLTEQFPEFLTDQRFYDMAKKLTSSSTNARLLIRYLDNYKRNNANKNKDNDELYDM